MSLFETQSTTPDERRRTILAVVLSTVIISVGFIVQNALFPPAEPAPQTTSPQTTSTGTAQPAAPASIVPAAA
ncbi:MAG: hypothetical protein N3A02_08465, partial [Rectinema sp.]|nr:hypothetical protein [Rectinema sp.]